MVVGEPEIPHGRITMPLTRQGGPRGERTVPAEKGEAGLRSVTEYKTLEVAKRCAAFLELHPQTGRTHQRTQQYRHEAHSRDARDPKRSEPRQTLQPAPR